MNTKASNRSLLLGASVASAALGALVAHKLSSKHPHTSPGAPADQQQPEPPQTPETPADQQQPEPPQTPETPADQQQPEPPQTPALRLRMWLILGVLVLSGLLASWLVTVLPVLGLTAALDPSNPALELDSEGRVLNGQELGLKLVVSSSVLWYLAIGGLLSLVSVIASAVCTTDDWKSFLLSKLVGVSAATFIGAAGIFGIVLG